MQLWAGDISYWNILMLLAGTTAPIWVAAIAGGLSLRLLAGSLIWTGTAVGLLVGFADFALMFGIEGEFYPQA